MLRDNLVQVLGCYENIRTYNTKQIEVAKKCLYITSDRLP